jgi:hypothetical protein
MFNFEQQVNQARQQAAGAGFSGNAILDVHPLLGVIRMKVDVTPHESLASFMTNYVQFLSIALGAMNIEAKVHITEEEKQ